MEVITGMSFDFAVDNNDFHANKFNLKISDETKAVFKNGRPNGHARGSVSGTGSLTLDCTELSKLTAMANKAGSWQDIPPFDLVAYAKVGDSEKKVEAFGCKMKLETILDADKSSTDQTTFDIPFEVTSPDFIKIDGVPYIKPKK